MKKAFADVAATINKYRRRKNWNRFVRILAGLVVFCTTYALILPAITLENPTCGFEEHEHVRECYQQLAYVAEEQLTCTLVDAPEHEHTEECYTIVETPVDNTALTCELEENIEHFHSELCYGIWEPVCEKPAHIHTDECNPVDYTKEPSAVEIIGEVVDATGEINGETTEFVEGTIDEETEAVEGTIDEETESIDETIDEETEADDEIVGDATESTDETVDEEIEADDETVDEEMEADGEIVDAETEADGEIVDAETESTDEITDEELIESTEEETESTEEIVPEIVEQVYADDDVIVTVIYGPEAGIPTDAQLVVSAYTESYEEYYAQAKEILADETTEDGEKLEIADFYLYDIHFVYEDQIIQPNEAVTVNVQFKNDEEIAEGSLVSVIHFAEEGTETLETTLIDENSSTTFQSDSFSPYGFSVMSLQARGKSYQDTLLAYFSFDDPDSGFKYGDVVAHKNGNATISKDSERGEVLFLDGTDDFLDVKVGDGGSLLTGCEAVTVSFWNKPNDPNSVTANWMFFANNNTNVDSNNETYIACAVRTGTYLSDQFYLKRLGGTPTPNRIEGGVAESKWQYVTAVYSSDRMALYVNGEQIGEDKSTDQSFLPALKDILGENSILQIGKANWHSGEYYNGYIDEFRVYGSALTDTEIKYLYEIENKTTKGYEKDLLAYFSFDELDAGFKYSSIGTGDANATATTVVASSEKDIDIKPGYSNKAYFLSGDDFLSVAPVQAEGEAASSLLTDKSAITVSYWSKPFSESGDQNKNWGFYAALPGTQQWPNNENYLGVLEEGSYHMMKYYKTRENAGSASLDYGTIDDQWCYITAVFSDEKMVLYVDGEMIKEQPATAKLSDILNTNSIVQIGKANYGSGEYYRGYIDEYRIYGTALTEDAIKHLYYSEIQKKTEHSYENTILAHFDFDKIETIQSDDSAAQKGFISTDGGAKAAITEDTANNFLTVTNDEGGSLLSGCDEITISYWSKPNDAADNNWSFYAAKNGEDATHHTYLGLLERGNYKLEQFNGTYDQYGVSGKKVIANEWHYITAVYSEAGLRLYVDGVLDADKHTDTFGSPADILGQNSILQIGKANWGKGEYYKGYMDEYRIFGSALTSADVADLYAKESKERTIKNTLTAATVDYDTFKNINIDDKNNARKFVIYTEYEGRYYAIASGENAGTGYAIPVTVNETTGTISWINDGTNNIFWTFEKGSDDNYFIKNVATNKYLHAYSHSNGESGAITTGGYESAVLIWQDGEGNTDNSVVIRGSEEPNILGNYFYPCVNFVPEVVDDKIVNLNTLTINPVSYGQGQAPKYWLATVDYQNVVWFDGTNGGLMSYYGSPDKPQFYYGGEFTLPETWPSPTKYEYKLGGWYDIKNNTRYDPGASVPITQDTVFYAYWVPVTYDIGKSSDEGVVSSLDTDNFITTQVFDYNVLFNMQSIKHEGTVTAAGHSETWTLVNYDEGVPYGSENSLNYIFLDYDDNGNMSYPFNRNTMNGNQNTITSGILNSRPSLLDTLFGKPQVIGKDYIGNGNHLFQYMDVTTGTYDGKHDGYFYYDSKLNAASYNQTENRFYLYNYLERTTDSLTGGGDGGYSDFLPFNSPTVNTNGKKTVSYTDSNGKTGYQYDAKDKRWAELQDANGNKISVEDSEAHITTNYHFGLRTDIRFYLPYDSGEKGEDGIYGNLSTTKQPMVFEFMGDDDLWICVDDQLMLDVGGMHGIRGGTIDFYNGVVTTYSANTTQGTEQTFAQILGEGKNIGEGTHTLSIYYLERGSSQSNCAIYFNLTPRFGLELYKQDYHSAESLNGAKFTVYSDEACAKPVILWDSRESADKGDTGKETFEVIDGVAKIWGLVAGREYYIKEVGQPEGYLETDDVVRIVLNNRGTISSSATVLPGENGKREPGFEIIRNSLTQDGNQTVQLVLSNQKSAGTKTKVKVEKIWADGSTNLPGNITVKLLKDGIEHDSVFLSESNDWVHVWEDLYKFRDDGITEIKYTIKEEHVPHYASEVVRIPTSEVKISWSGTESLENGGQYMLTNGGQGLTVTDDGKLQWIDAVVTTDVTEFAAWSAEASGNGFVLSYGDYKLTFDQEKYRFIASEGSGDQTLYFATDESGNKLYAVYGNKQYELGEVKEDGTAAAVESDGLGIVLMKMITTIEDVTYFKVTNTPVAYELPETGGHGTVMYTVSGLAAVAAALLGISRRRKRT